MVVDTAYCKSTSQHLRLPHMVLTRARRRSRRPADGDGPRDQEGLSQDGHGPPSRYAAALTVPCRARPAVPAPRGSYHNETGRLTHRPSALQTRIETTRPPTRSSRPSAKPTKSSPTPTFAKPTISSERTMQNHRRASPTPPSSSPASLVVMPLWTGSARSA